MEVVSDAQWPWEKQGTLFWLVDFKGTPFPKKREEKRTPLGSWVVQHVPKPGPKASFVPSLRSEA